MNRVEAFYSQVIPVGLWVVMLGMGLALTMGDIRNIFAMPKAILVGLFGQMVLLPILGFILAVLFAPTPEIAVGVLILASCPGGVTSNAYSFATRADVALSVSLTAANSFLTIITLPILTFFAINYFLDEGSVPQLPVMEMILTLANLTVVPVVIGMVIRKLWNDKAAKLIETLRTATFIFLILLVVAGTIVSIDVLKQYFLQAAFVATALNVLAMIMGYLVGLLFRLNVPQRVAIVYEIGIHNISLASLISLSLLGNQQFFVITLVYAVIMKVTALSFMYIARRWLINSATQASAGSEQPNPPNRLMPNPDH